jgi:5-methyltetrahydrofolate--homocysteine methyltransferase
MTSFAERQQALSDALATRILVLDGAMGTMLQQRELTVADRGGAVLQDCPEYLVKSRPDVITDIHRAYLAAGADIIETNSFGSTPLVLSEFGIGDQARDINLRAAKLARDAADAFSTSSRPRWVAASIGPTTKTLSVAGGITFPELEENFYQQIRYLVEGGIDIILIETCIDTRNIKAALIAAQRVMKDVGHKVPVMVSGTIEVMGTMLAGQPADALWVSLQNADLMSIGLNCATGPEFMTDHIRTLSDMATTNVSCYPNAGLPDADGKYLETPQSLAEHLDRFIRNGWLNIVGGCCGTTSRHIQAISEMADGRKPRQIKPSQHRTYFSGTEVVEVEESSRPLIVGERTNVIGSRIFKNLIAAEKWEEAVEIARRQVKNGAHIIDVCLQSTDRDEIADIPQFYEKLIRAASKPPIMIDTTDPKAIELALTYCQGKSIINSINLEDGEEKFEKVCPIAKAYGAALIVGTIDEDKVQAQAFTRERKLAVAQRSVDLLTTKYSIAPEDIVIDPLVFPCGTGDANYIGGSVETIEAIRMIKQAIPYVRTALGISNISFGLPPAAREIINSVFLYHCTRAGLDLAIVNAEKLERYATIPEKHRKLAEDLLFNHSADPSVPTDWRQQTPEQKVEINKQAIHAITEEFRNVAVKEKTRAADLPLDQRLANYIIEGSKDGLIADLDLKRAEGAGPLEIINGPLMAGMTEVGRLFNNNELIVAEVLQSAEAMKAAVSHLEKFMEKADTATRGKIILATVKGDVHDIGKNLVEIILSNNGYQVINLGIKIPPEKLIEAWVSHRADAIGLSGLLVKSAQQMVITANDLKEAGINVPLLVGGAALSETFTNTRIGPAYGDAAVCYAKDAMTGLRIMNQLMDPAERESLLAEYRKKPGIAVAAHSQTEAAAPVISTERSRKVRVDIPIPAAPYLDRRVRSVPELPEVWSYINPFMLYGRHLGYKGRFEQDLSARDHKALELYNMVEELKEFAKEFMQVKVVWQFFEAERDANSIHLYEPKASQPLHTFHFGRQPRENGLCLSDYILPAAKGQRDHLAFFVCTAGAGIREKTEVLKSDGQYFKAHGLQALAIETAEGCAEWIHRRIREDWGFADPATMTMQERFTSRYRGKRYSFGYPACPNLDDQQGLFKLLRPAGIGVELTEGMMMEPEASVSALVFHHPDAVYFTASDAGGEAAAAD